MVQAELEKIICEIPSPEIIRVKSTGSMAEAEDCLLDLQVPSSEINS
jgi:hypothetical protein